ncbi:hypothetical protein MXB_1359 [Myxobolus squamalis]|nr:hypothetical protein MXB_1359 [Myxobolus squamalis]
MINFIYSSAPNNNFICRHPKFYNDRNQIKCEKYNSTFLWLNEEWGNIVTIGIHDNELKNIQTPYFIKMSDFVFHDREISPLLFNYTFLFDSTSFSTRELFIFNSTEIVEKYQLFGAVKKLENGFLLEQPDSSVYLLLGNELKNLIELENGFSLTFMIKFYKKNQNNNFLGNDNCFDVFNSGKFSENSLFTAKVSDDIFTCSFKIRNSEKSLIWKVIDPVRININSWNTYVITWHIQTGLSLHFNGMKVTENKYPIFDISENDITHNAFIGIGAKNNFVEKTAYFQKFQICCVSYYHHYLHEEIHSRIFGIKLLIKTVGNFYRGIKCQGLSEIFFLYNFSSDGIDLFENKIKCDTYFLASTLTNYLFRIKCAGLCKLSLNYVNLSTENNITREWISENNSITELLDNSVYVYKKAKSKCKGVKHSIWTDIYTYSLDSLVNLSTFPDDPSLVMVAQNFLICANQMMNYGALLYAYYKSSISGNFSFTLISLGPSQL